MSSKEKSTSRVKLPPQSADEKSLQGLVVEASENQYKQIEQQMAFQNQLFGELMGSYQQLYGGGEGDQYGAGATEGGQASGQRLVFDDPEISRILGTGASSSLLALELERARTGVATPEQAAAIGQAADLAFSAGASDIETAATRATQSLQRELAPQLGLRGRDSPIVERAGRIGEESIRQVGQLSRNVRTTQQQALLDASQRQGALNQGLMGQTLDLSQRAFQNRLSLLGEAGRLGLGIAGIGNPAENLQIVQQPRLAQTSTTNTTSPSTLSKIGQYVSIGGSALSSISSIAGSSGGYSSLAMKQRLGPVPTEEWAKLLAEIPVEFWTYRADETDTIHAGPYAEHFREAFGLGDGEQIGFLDAIGVLFGVVQHLLKERDDG